MRKYLVFGSDDGRAWQALGTVQAGSHAQAQDAAADQESGFEYYGSTPYGNWNSRSVVERTVRKWNTFDIAAVHGQMTIGEETDADQHKVDEMIEKAKDALDKPLIPGTSEQ